MFYALALIAVIAVAVMRTLAQARVRAEREDELIERLVQAVK